MSAEQSLRVGSRWTALARAGVRVIAACALFGCTAEPTEPTFPGPSGPSGPAGFGRAVLSRAARNPMGIAITPRSDVYTIERTGEVRLFDAETGHESEALQLEVDTAHENGLLGIALAPDFATTRAIFLYHSLPLVEPLPADEPPGRNVLARFVARSDGTIDPVTREEILSVPSERRCCHEGGSLAFAPDGTLFVSTGDNTNPFESSGMAPLDGRPGRERFDSRRTSANPFDLRGKILRIEPDGGIPAGNLFPLDGSAGRPEIYALGARNPFRIALDSENGRLFFADIGPDAVEDQTLGPRGYDEINLVQGPGDFGWPFCIGANLPYVERDFAAGAVGAPFDCSARVPAIVAYDYATETYPALGTAYTGAAFTGRSAIAGAVYRAPAGAPFALPDSYAGRLLIADWTRDIVAAIHVGDSDASVDVERLFGTELFHRPIDIEIGPDGAVYVLEFGSGLWGDNEDAALSRIEYGPRLSPAAVISASVTSGAVPLEVRFSGASSRVFGAGETIVEYAWDFDGDGRSDTTGIETTHVFTAAGERSVTLRVTSSSGAKSVPVSEAIAAGNAAPTVRILSPDPLATVFAGIPITFRGEANDPEDGTPPCEELVWNVSLGHNAHAHPSHTLRGCTVSFTPELDDHAGTGRGEVLFYAIELVYTDRGGPGGEAPLTGRAGLKLDVAH